jgi:hypothetical protein
VDLNRVIVELRTYLELLDDAILSLERLDSQKGRSLKRSARAQLMEGADPSPGAQRKGTPAGEYTALSAGAEFL